MKKNSQSKSPIQNQKLKAKPCRSTERYAMEAPRVAESKQLVLLAFVMRQSFFLK